MTAAAITVSRRAIERVRGGHPWIDRADVITGPGEAADLVSFGDGRRILGAGLHSARSRVAVRVMCRGPEALDEDGLERLLDARIGAALARRRSWFPDADAFRVAHAEADLLPGLVVDRYGDVAVIQTTCAAMDGREGRIAAIVQLHLGARLVIARDDGSARDFDELPRRRGVLLGTGSAIARCHDAGSAIEVDLLGDDDSPSGRAPSRKTGGFLDQQENHARAAGYARALPSGGEALDAFCYHGGYALGLARAGMRVTALDEDPQAIDALRANARRNEVSIDARCVNAFDALRELEAEGRRFDLIVIDPPALARRGGGGAGQGAALAAAERAYKELNLRGLRLLRPGGILITCSCSGKLSIERFGRIVADAAADVGRPVQLLERRGAGRDHPALLALPDTEYLKCWILRALE